MSDFELLRVLSNLNNHLVLRNTHLHRAEIVRAVIVFTFVNHARRADCQRAAVGTAKQPPVKMFHLNSQWSRVGRLFSLPTLDRFYLVFERWHCVKRAPAQLSRFLVPLDRRGAVASG